MQNNILHEIETFLSDTGLSAYRFGWLAVNNGRLVERLRRGGRVWPEQHEKIAAFIATQREIRIHRRTHAKACKPAQTANSTAEAAE